MSYIKSAWTLPVFRFVTKRKMVFAGVLHKISPRHVQHGIAMVSLKWFSKTSFISFETGVKNKLQHSKWPNPHPIMSIVGEDFCLLSWGRDSPTVLSPPGKNAWPPREMPSRWENQSRYKWFGWCNNVRAPAGDMLSFSKSRWHEMPQYTAVPLRTYNSSTPMYYRTLPEVSRP